MQHLHRDPLVVAMYGRVDGRHAADSNALIDTPLPLEGKAHPSPDAGDQISLGVVH
jgi:hypothetical protein